MSDFFGECNGTFQPQNKKQSSSKIVDHYQDEAIGILDFSDYKSKKTQNQKTIIKNHNSNKGTSSLLFGILSWVLSIIPFLFPILAICLSKNSITKRAKAGKILGIIGMIKDGLVLVVAVYLQINGYLL